VETAFPRILTEKYAMITNTEQYNNE